MEDVLIERWAHKEIIDFLDICKQKRILNRMTNKKYRFDDILHDIKVEMDSLGYNRTIHQMRLKFKKLRQRYKQCLVENSTGNRLKRQFAFFDVLHEMEHNRHKECLIDELDKVELEVNYKEESPKEYRNFGEIHYEKSNPLESTSKIFDTAMNEEHVHSTKSNNKVRNKSASIYLESFKFLVTNFKKAQEELQKSFFNQQMILQQQQQEWEEKILDEEREFFAKILKCSNVRRS